LYRSIKIYFAQKEIVKLSGVNVPLLKYSRYPEPLKTKDALPIFLSVESYVTPGYTVKSCLLNVKSFPKLDISSKLYKAIKLSFVFILPVVYILFISVLANTLL